MLRALLSVFLLRLVALRLQTFPDVDTETVIVAMRPAQQTHGRGA